uniref:Uncharacterized protein n=1 Tax=Arundo donax TaxID=35708 RepID=A0A0A9FCC9_ARUDO
MQKAGMVLDLCQSTIQYCQICLVFCRVTLSSLLYYNRDYCRF